jgi:hypothetical protein
VVHHEQDPMPKAARVGKDATNPGRYPAVPRL